MVDILLWLQIINSMWFGRLAHEHSCWECGGGGPHYDRDWSLRIFPENLFYPLIRSNGQDEDQSLVSKSFLCQTYSEISIVIGLSPLGYAFFSMRKPQKTLIGCAQNQVCQGTCSAWPMFRPSCPYWSLIQAHGVVEHRSSVWHLYCLPPFHFKQV